jgi:cobalt-zinc-cadmium efflux system outer membrane protein
MTSAPQSNQRTGVSPGGRLRPSSAAARAVAIVGIVFGAVLVAVPARAEDAALDAFVSEVVRTNSGLRARVLEGESMRLEASAAGIWPDPEIALMFDNFPDRMGGEMPMVRYQLSQMLMWPGKLASMEASLTRRAESKAAMARLRKLELVREAKRAYLMLALNAGLRRINHSSRELLTTVVNAALARYGAGTGGHHEVVRAEVERNVLEVEAFNLEGERVSTLAMMNALRNARTEVTFPDPPEPTAPASPVGALAELVRLAERRRPELESMQAMQREEVAMATLARRERMPDLMTSVWYNQMLGAPDSMGIMLGARLPLFNLTRQTRRAEAADLRGESVRHDVEAMRAMIRFEITDALRRVETAARSLDLVMTVAIPAAQQSFASSLAGFSTGSLDVVGVLEAWRALQSVERARLDASIAGSMALADLERAAGGSVPRASP